MSARTGAAIGIWRARQVRTIGDRMYTVYMALMVTLIAVAPVAYAVWLSVTSPTAVALFASPAAPGVTALVVAVLWSSALLLGRDRGPALRPPFLTYALATSDRPRSYTFCAPVLRAGAFMTTVTTIVAGLVAGSLVSQGHVEPFSAAVFMVAGALSGIIATVAWLAGQAVPRVAVPLALGVLTLGAATAVVPVLQPFAPWGWVSLAYPRSDASHTLAALVALASVLLAVVPVLMNRLSFAVLAVQAARWDSATAHATSMDFNMATARYQGRPHTGRRIRAVRPMSRLAWTFLIRDAIGATRAPGRLIVAFVALTAGAVLMTLAFAPATPGWLLGAAAGLMIFAGLGPLTDGIRHAAGIARDLPLYGISDEHLLANHALFPLAIVVLVLLTAAIVCSNSTGVPPAAPVVGALTLGLLAFFARVSNALKGPLPPSLLTPISTPMGDLGPAVVMIWALDGVLLAALAGASVALTCQAPVLLIGVSVALLGVGITRWRHRGA